MKKVGIIGGAGFIGSHITKTFLENDYQVKVATTDISREDKYQHLMHFKNAENLYISELDVADKEQLEDFVTDCDYVIHGGTPFILDFQDAETELFDPTIKGTQNFLEVVKKTTGIEKVILIASVAGWNTNFPMPANGKDFFDTFDETDTRFTSTESHPYAQAKFIANQVVAQFINDHPELPFEITTVSPVAVMGKQLSERDDSTSTGLQFLFKNKIAPNDFIQLLYDTDMPFAMVDVADVALAVYKATITKGIHGKDYLLSSETFKVSDIHEMLNGREPISTSQIVYKNDLAKRDLGISFRPIIETFKNQK